MPLASYDYDYYEYTNGRRVNKTSYSVAPAKRATTTTQTRKNTSNVSAPKRKTTSNAPRTTTRQNVSRAPVKKTTNNTSKKVSTKTTTNKKKVEQTIKPRKHNIDIPLTTSSKIVNKPKEMTLKKPKTKKSTADLKDALTKIFGVGIFFAIASVICYRYSLINEQFIELKDIKKEYATIQNVNEQIEADIESKTDLTYIENYAKYQLGMQKPSNSQMRYVNIENKDKIITPITIEEDLEKGWFESFCEEIRKVLD